MTHSGLYLNNELGSIHYFLPGLQLQSKYKCNRILQTLTKLKVTHCDIYLYTNGIYMHSTLYIEGHVEHIRKLLF